MNNRVAVWKQAQKPRVSARKFFHKHERLLTFVGGIIVFATFVMREGVLERLREASSAVREVQSAFHVSEVTTTASSVAGWPGEIIERAERLDKGTYYDEDEEKAQKAEVEDILEVRPFLRRALTQWNWNLDERSRLAEILPDGQLRKDEIKKLQDETKNVTEAFDRIPRLSVAEFRAKRGTEEATERQAIGEAFESFSNVFEKQLRKQMYVSNAIDNELQARKTRAERWYKRSTVASYFLYSLGWGLGLVGKIYGFGSGSGD
jgi:hypothetical protein